MLQLLVMATDHFLQYMYIYICIPSFFVPSFFFFRLIFDSSTIFFFIITISLIHYKKKILSVPHVRKLIVGIIHVGNRKNNVDNKRQHNKIIKIRIQFLERLYCNMIRVIVQSVISSTYDIREMIRLACLLWPLYLSSPILMQQDEGCTVDSRLLDHGNVSSTSSMVGKNALGALVETLLQRSYPYMRHLLSRCLFQPGRGYGYFSPNPSASCFPTTINNGISPFANDFPYLMKFLLLSAFLCKNNCKSHDKRLYTNEKSKTRTKSLNKGSNDGVAFGLVSSSSSSTTLTTRRMATFPRERMLSIFSSIVGRYGSNDSLPHTIGSSNDDLHYHSSKKGSINVQMLGTVHFFESLVHLRSLGFLERRCNGLPSLDATNVQYNCNISRALAEEISNEVQFPLGQYLME